MSGVFRVLLILLLLVPLVVTAGSQYPLEPPDTSSPRATFEAFMAVTDEITARYTEYRDSPSPATHDRFMRASDKAVGLMDLSEIAPASRREAGIETFLLLWEVIARLELPDLAEIPDVSATKEGDEKAEKPPRWRIPHTAITIVRVEQGPRAGEFLFSPDTVAQAQSFYEQVREMPYQRPVPVENLSRTAQLLTGWMIPATWVEALPGWANTTVLRQVLWKWFAVLLLFGLAFGMVIAVFRWARRRPWDGSLRSYLRHLSTPLVILVVVPLLRYLTEVQINVTGRAAEGFELVIEVFNFAAAVWVVWLTASRGAETIIASPRINPESLDASLIRLAARSIGIGVGLVIVFRAAHQVGVPVYGLVAGVGVGGIAVALAAKNTLENFIGSLNLFADRPVRVGDLCRYDNDPTSEWRPVGRVESIGLRSTKVRHRNGTLITIPNAEFAQRHIVNLSACDRMLLNTTLRLRYETTDDQLRFVLAELRKLLLAHPRIVHTAEPVRVRFVDFGDFSLDIYIRAYVDTSSRNEFLAVQEDLFLRVMSVVKRAGSGFAFPSQTLYHTRDEGVDADRQQQAEKRVREWVSAQTLPFPDFTDDYQKQVMDTLDYPPEGSPEADKGCQPAEDGVNSTARVKDGPDRLSTTE